MPVTGAKRVLDPVRVRLAALALGLLALLAPGAALAQLKGDANGNARIDAGDALLALRIATRQTTSPAPAPTQAQTQAVDVVPLVNGIPQGNGTVDMGDAVLLARAVADEDVDGDGVPNSIEIALNLSGVSRNTDGVGLDDGALDSDGDGISNRAEVAQGSNPGNMSDRLSRTLNNVTLSATTTFFPGRAYRVSGTLTLAQGVTLTIQPGAVLEFEAGALFLVQGTLRAQGTQAAPIQLRSAAASPAPGNWQGVRIDVDRAPDTLLDQVWIRHAVIAVAVAGFGNAATRKIVLTRSRLLDFSSIGFRSEGANWNGEVRDNLFQNIARVGTGISFSSAPDPIVISGNQLRGLATGVVSFFTSPTITNSQIEDNTVGVLIGNASSPRIQSNRIVGNEVGIQRVFSAGLPVVNDNVIAGNTRFNFQSDNISGFGFVNAERNFWGSVDPLAIQASIQDAFPVDFVPFLSGDPAAGGVPVSEQGLLIGELRPATGTVVQVPSTAIAFLLGPAIVPPGITLEVAAGVNLQVSRASAILFVEGTLRVLGTSSSQVRIAPVLPALTWRGIVLGETSTASLIDNAILEKLSANLLFDFHRGSIDVRGGELTIQNSIVRDFRTFASGARTAAIVYRNGARGRIQNVTVDSIGDATFSNGILIDSSSPELIGNTIRNTRIALFIFGPSTALIRGGNVITGNGLGILLEGTGNPGGSPRPTINGNSIFGNRLFSGAAEENVVLANLLKNDYTAPLDLRGNFFGTTDRAAIRATIVSRFPVTLPSDFSGYLSSAGGPPAAGSDTAFTRQLLVPGPAVVAFAPALGETAGFTAQPLVPASNLTVSVYDDRDLDRTNLIRRFDLGASPAAPVQVTWDGRDSQGRVVADGAYRFVIEAQFLVGSELHDPPGRPEGEGTGTIPSSFNPFRNEPFRMNYQLVATGGASTRPARLSVLVRPNSTATNLIATKVDAAPCLAAGTCFFAIEDRVVLPGTTSLSFDGFTPSGELITITDPTRFDFLVPISIGIEAVVVRSSNPDVRGKPPQIDVRSDPFVMAHTYDQISSLTYRLDRTSVVTVRILPPGSSSTPVATLVNAQTQPAKNAGGATIDYTVTYNGHGSAAGTSNDIVSTAEGAYRYVIEARDPSDAARVTLRRGVINVRR